MATTSSRKSRIKDSPPLEVVLDDTRITKFKVETFRAPEEAAKGTLELTYNITLPPEVGTKAFATTLILSGKGMDKTNPELIAFTFESEMAGIFRMSRDPINEEEMGKASTLMANLMIPSLTDTIEMIMYRTGYPRLSLQKNFPPPIKK